MAGPISFWGYKEQESNLILPEHHDDLSLVMSSVLYSGFSIAIVRRSGKIPVQGGLHPHNTHSTHYNVQWQCGNSVKDSEYMGDIAREFVLCCVVSMVNTVLGDKWILNQRV
jgi:hypothetical protein